MCLACGSHRRGIDDFPCPSCGFDPMTAVDPQYMQIAVLRRIATELREIMATLVEMTPR